MTERDDYLWDPKATPVPDIVAIERALAPYRHRHESNRPSLATRPHRRGRRWIAVAATAAVIVTGIGITMRVSRQRPWTVDVHVDGGATRRVGAGGVIVTEAAPATLAVGSIGTVVLAPRSELAVVDTGAAQNRLALRRGGMDVRVWAPPRFFVVDVPGASAIDLGCIYRLEVDSTGIATLEVQYGAVDVASGAHHVVVPEGTGITIRPSGAGVPWSLASSRTFRDAADAIAFGQGDSAALETVLAAGTSRESITLWHLLAHVDEASRARLVARIVQLTGSPDVLRRDAVVALDSAALVAWRGALQRKWSLRLSWWQRALIRFGVMSPAPGAPARGGRQAEP